MKKIYLLTTERNMKMQRHAPKLYGGLFVNIGETNRDAIEGRLSDSDYRKSSGGLWVVLKRFVVADTLSDRDFHKALDLRAETHGDVEHSGNSCNTEEYLIKTDCGDGEKAKEILELIFQQLTDVDGARQAVRALSQKHAFGQLQF